MQTQTYLDRAARVACESQLAVQVLLSRANDDIAFVRLVPSAGPAYMPAEEFTARQFRSVGIIGLCGLSPRIVFKEPLEDGVAEAIGAAFTAYVQTLIGEQFASQMQAAELAELERLFMLPDTRPH